MNSMKNGKINTSNSREGYSLGLAKSVAQACDAWLEKRGMKNLAWKDRQKLRRKKEKKRG